MNVKPSDKAEMQVLKDLVDHLKASLLDLEENEQPEAEVSVIELDAEDAVDPEAMEEVAEEELEMPEVDDALDSGEGLEDELADDAEEDFDLEKIFRLK